MTTRRLRWPLVAVSAVIWVLLWGDLSVANLASGAVLGLLIGIVFPLPPLPPGVRLRPVGVLVLVGTLLVDLVPASLVVAARVLRPGPMRNAIIRVQLRTRSDLVLTLAAELTTLVPGSTVIEVRREVGVLYVHVMDVSGPGDLDRARAQTLAAEARVLRAFGSAEELALLGQRGRERVR